MDLPKYILIFFSCITINAQQSTSLKEDRFNSSLISPTIVHGEMYFSGITNGNNKTIVSFNAYKDTGYEKYDFGATFINSYPMISGMLYITKDCDWFVVSLSIGAYKFNNRSASYSGVYLSHNYNSGYFGFGMADIIDVGFKNGTEDDFFYFDARTPQVFAFQKIIDLYDFSMGLGINGSHHRIEKWNYKAPLEFGYKGLNT